MGKKRLCYIVGGVAAGKTSLINSVQKSAWAEQTSVALEPVEWWENVHLFNVEKGKFVEEEEEEEEEGRERHRQEYCSFLKKFYEDKKTYGFAFQVFILGTLFDVLERKIRQAKENEIVICERSLFCSVNVFAKLLYEGGYISNLEFTVLYELATILQQRLGNTSNLIIFLNCPATSCLDRVKKRGRDSEQDVTENYLDSVNTSYYNWFTRNKFGELSPVGIYEIPGDVPPNTLLADTYQFLKRYKWI